ncbi:MAG: lipoprotein [Burkholderiales bacterium]|jgi:predicted small lipoprotein YifL|nr:lipoprotein [Burkholderiales bacterium]
MRITRLLLTAITLASVAFTLSACGQKGPLVPAKPLASTSLSSNH